ncbi:MAG: site-2 protease family protein [Candidatus Lokiarchaeota archaeon]|nr:site-2 protease family protein [Candidatus Lokiarchaeota archaeon]
MFLQTVSERLIEAAIYILIVWIFIYLAYKVFDLKNKGVELGPFIVIYKTKRLSIIEKLSKKYPWAWKIAFSAGIVIGFIGMSQIFIVLLQNLINFFVAPLQASPVLPLLPGITISSESLPYIIFGLAVVLLTHEISHGVAARIEGVKLKSAGLLLLAILPGAFVEPEEEDIKKVSPVARLRIFGAGSFSNIVTSLLILLLLTNFALVIAPFFGASNGVLITDVAPGGPSDGILERGDIIYSINGMPTQNVQELSEILSTVQAFETIELETDEGIIQFKTGARPDDPTKGYLGVFTFNHYQSRIAFLGKFFPVQLFTLLQWTFLLTLNIGLLNLLPILFLDGDRMLTEVVNYVSQKYNLEIVGKVVLNGIRAFTLMVLLLNIIMTFLNMGLVAI